MNANLDRAEVGGVTKYAPRAWKTRVSSAGFQEEKRPPAALAKALAVGNFGDMLVTITRARAGVRSCTAVLWVPAPQTFPAWHQLLPFDFTPVPSQTLRHEGVVLTQQTPADLAGSTSKCFHALAAIVIHGSSPSSQPGCNNPREAAAGGILT